MTTLTDWLDNHFFSGSTGNLAYDVLKKVWAQATDKSWEERYLAAFTTTVKDPSLNLSAYASGNGEISVDQVALAHALHQDLRVALEVTTLSALGEDQFVHRLAKAMAEQNALVIADHKLTDEDYTQLLRNLIRQATSSFKATILSNDALFRRALLDEVQRQSADVREVQARFIDRFDLVAGQFQEILAELQVIRQQQAQLPDAIAAAIREATSSNMISVLLAERDQLRTRLLSDRERMWADRFEELRVRVDAGYTAAIRARIITLVEDVQRAVQAGEVLDRELVGRIYRLAAIAMLPNRPDGDAHRCRLYLELARPLSAGMDVIKCQIIDAVLVYHEQGLDAGLERLAGLTNQEAIRIRFGLALEQDQLSTCHQMLDSRVINIDWIETDVNWARILALYYGAIGDRAMIDRCVTSLTSGVRTADHLEVAGLTYTRIAYAHLYQFCLTHQVFLEFHYALQLDALLDAESYERAIVCFTEAATLYQHEQCLEDAARTLVAALRLLIDRGTDERRHQLLARLRQVAPDHLMLTTLPTSIADAEPARMLIALERGLQSPASEPMLLLHLAQELAAQESLGSQVVDLLQQYHDRFVDRDVTRVQYAFQLFTILQRTEGVDKAALWLESFTAPIHHEHLRPLWYVALYLEYDLQRAVDYLNDAITMAPGHPEVLAAAIIVANRQGQHDAQVGYTQRLFRLLQTPQTATWLVSSLLDAHRWLELLQTLETLNEDLLPEDTVRSSRASAYIGLDQLLRAETDLEWLYKSGRATAQGLITLARIYQLHHRQEEATAVLRVCIQRFANEPAGYLTLSHTLLTAGEHDDSFTVARTAAERFSDDPGVAAHLFDISFPAGHELDEGVERLMADFAPGGRFAASGFLELRPFTDAIEMLQTRQMAAQQISGMYQQGRISLLLLCYRFGRPLCYDHWTRIHERIPRLVPIVDDQDDTALWSAATLPVVVLDYSALLTLWSLFRETFLKTLRAHVDRVYIPEKLLYLLDWEQHDLARRGQPTWHHARLTVRDTVLHEPSKFIRYEPVRRPEQDASVVDGQPPASEPEESDSLIHIVDTPPGESVEVPTIGLYTLADLLYREGAIMRRTFQALTRSVQQPRPDEAEQVANLSRDSAIVADMSILTQLALADALGGFSQYFSRVYYTEPGWQLLLREIAEFDDIQRMERDLHMLRDVLRGGIEDGFICLESLTPEQHYLRPLRERHNADGDAGDGRDTALLDLAFDYTDELVGLAHFHHLPLWTDDRWVGRLMLPERQPAAIFGTDSFLAWLRSKGVNDNEVFDLYGQLARWGYRGLLINTDYILWLINRGLSPESMAMSDVLQLYRATMLDLLGALGDPPEWNAAYIRQVFKGYNDRLLATLVQCFQHHIESSLAATLLQHLDLSRHAPGLAGKEPLYLNDLLLDLIMRVHLQVTDIDTLVSTKRELCLWLDNVIVCSGVDRQTIDEAWHWTAQILRMIYDDHRDEPEEARAYVWLQVFLMAMPEPAREWLLTTRLGGWLRREFNDLLAPQKLFTTQPPGQEQQRLEYPQARWEHDYDRAVTRYLAAPTDAPVTAGIVTVQSDGTRVGSPFIRLRTMPTAWVSRYQVRALSGRLYYTCVLGHFGHREKVQRLALWNTGRLRLRQHGLSESDWLRLRTELTDRRSHVWRRAGREARAILLGYWAVARDYLAEAAELGVTAMTILLPYIDPDVVRGWLDMPKLNWSDKRELQHWAERVAENFEGAARAEGVPAALRALLPHYGHSIFPDSAVIHERLMAYLVKGNPTDDQIMQTLMEIGQATASRALKANIVVFSLSLSLAPQASDFPEDSPLIDSIAQLLEQIAGPTTRQPILYQSQVHFAGQLCYYLYTTWRENEALRSYSPDALAYLASTGAHLIVDAIAAYTDNQTLDELSTHLRTLITRKHLLRRPAQQPVGLYRPAWHPFLNYDLAFLIGAVRSMPLDLSRFVAAHTVREALLAGGAVERLFQACFDSSIVMPGWLDELLVSDTSQIIASILDEPPDIGTPSWSDEQRYLWLTCALSEAGVALIEGGLDRLPQSSDDEVLQVIGMVFLGVYAPNGGALTYLEKLLDVQQLQRIRQSAQCYSNLIWRLGELLRTSVSLSESTLQSARGVLVEAPVSDSGIDGLSMAKAAIFAVWAEREQHLDLIFMWLEQIASSQSQTLEAVRGVLQTFIRRCGSYPLSVRSRLFRLMTNLRSLPIYGQLWEVHRLIEECR